MRSISTRLRASAVSRCYVSRRGGGESSLAIATSIVCVITASVSGASPSSTLLTAVAFCRGGRTGRARSAQPVCHFLLLHSSFTGRGTAVQAVDAFPERFTI